jgi:hypothetical protein
VLSQQQECLPDCLQKLLPVLIEPQQLLQVYSIVVTPAPW